MNTAERVSFAVCLFVAGLATGMYIEHERFLKEMKGLSKQHADAAPKPDAKPEQVA